MPQKSKTPAWALAKAGAACDVVDTRSDIASRNFNSTNPTQEKALVKKQAKAAAKFSEIQSSRGASVRPTLSLPTDGTTPRNAWLAAQPYKVEKHLQFKAHGYG